MLRLTARHADIWHAAGPSVAAVRAERSRVDAACRAEGREPNTLERNVSVLVDFTDGRGIPPSINPARLPPLIGPPEAIAAELRAIFAEGINHIQLTPFPATLAGVEALAPVLEHLHQSRSSAS
jgi:alkanesulfonate monooxygenase SsuD/methylene tetrahydromethanopterin reductase-like flavin-dependent oxidoreductase (luciferase family)